jgi:phosphatidylserine/phosphatidylglycerophosphate/cardiolipin synthase-like enzyme
MHHKVLILDDETVILGSFNFTKSANESNDENVLILHDPGFAARFRAEFERVYTQATQAGDD